ncbi:MAG: GNAT family protein [Bacteroidia bacterium]|nr:GNAT family protein [Bacteroidia bacterium]
MKLFLKDDLITLRALEPEDIDLLFEWENSEDNWTVSQTISPFSKHTLAIYIRDSDKDIFEAKQLRMMITTHAGKTVGAIDLFDFDPLNMRVGVGILIHDQEDKSKGYATSALNLMVRYCFGKLGLHQIYANILTDNEVSMKLFSKAGFVLSGTKKDWVRDGSNWKDEHLLQLLRRD